MRNRNYIILVLITLISFISCFAFSQEVDSETLTELKKNFKITSATYEEYSGLFFLKKKNKVGLGNLDELILPIEYDSIKLDLMYENIYLVWRKGKVGAVDGNNKIILPLTYSQIYYDNSNEGNLFLEKDNKTGYFEIYHKKIVLEPIYDSLKLQMMELYDIEGQYYGNYYDVYLDGKHRYFQFENPTIEIITTGYSTKQKKLLEALQADTLVQDGINGDGVFKARIEASQKWGMYQSMEGPLRIIIPPDYDSLYFFGWNNPFTIVFNQGKSGYFLWQWADNEETESKKANCIYEKYRKVYDSKERWYFAGQLDGKWYWIDWYNDKKTRDYGYDTYEDMRVAPIDLSEYYRR